MRKSLIYLLLIFLGCSSSRAELPDLGGLPNFELINQAGKTVRLQDYQDKVWVANFIFTSCAGTCPLLTQRMKKVQHSIKNSPLENNVRIVSFSVDPERDTPEKLATYAKTYEVSDKIWDFLTGPSDQINRTVVEGFKISMAKVPRKNSVGSLSAGEIFDVVHGEKFILVDGKGRIRGYYDSDNRGIKKLMADVELLANKGKGQS